MKILGIETSCDETSVAIVNDQKEILTNVILDQIKLHSQYGGVVPEVASRAHLNNIDQVFKQALFEAKLKLSDIDLIAVTTGPGLIGGLIVGAMYAKSIAFASDKKLISVNHLAGHALSVRLTSNINFPYLMILLSGGHCQILIVHSATKYQLIGQTLDDSLGEAFDKVAKMLNLGYPGGPVIEKLALKGDPNAFKFPIAMQGRSSCDFSFSGLKTAVRQKIEQLELNQQIKQDICASFQNTVRLILLDRLERSFNFLKLNNYKITSLAIAGGVAANQYLLEALKIIACRHDLTIFAPPIKLCTDNAAMIAWAGYEMYQENQTQNLDFILRSRWPLEIL